MWWERWAAGYRRDRQGGSTQESSPPRRRRGESHRPASWGQFWWLKVPAAKGLLANRIFPQAAASALPGQSAAKGAVATGGPVRCSSAPAPSAPTPSALLPSTQLCFRCCSEIQLCLSELSSLCPACRYPSLKRRRSFQTHCDEGTWVLQELFPRHPILCKTLQNIQWFWCVHDRDAGFISRCLPRPDSPFSPTNQCPDQPMEAG